MKFVPFTVSVKALPPAVTEEGVIDVVVGTGLLIVKVCPPDVPPPGAGLNTVTLAVPALAISAAVMLACRDVAETNVVVRSEPFHRTIEPAMKFVPV